MRRYDQRERYYRHMLEDQSIDAVLVATPQHLHCEHSVASLDAGKHVYQEKTMAFTVDHAKRMRAACQRAGLCMPGVRFCPGLPALQSAAT